MNTSFNVINLSPFFRLEESRMTPFQEGENDEEISAMHAHSSPNATHQVPLTRSRAKKLQEQMNSFLSDCNFHTSENVILPKCSILVVLKNIFEEKEEKLLQNDNIRKVSCMKIQTSETYPMNVQTNVQTLERSSHNSQLHESLEALEDILESSSSPISNASTPTSFGHHNQELCLD